MAHHNPFRHHSPSEDTSAQRPDNAAKRPDNADEMSAGEKAELRRQLALEVETFEQGIEG